MGKGVSLSWGGLDKAIMNAGKKLANKKLLLNTIGETLVSGTLKRFQAEEEPSGKKWKASQRARDTGGVTLSDTGRLSKSILAKTGNDEVFVGSNLVYARIHQLGGEIKPKKGKALKFGKNVIVSKVKMPARPYLGVSTADLAEVKADIAAFLKGAFGK